MNFGMDYFSLLTGRMNNSNYILNQYANKKSGKTSNQNGFSNYYGAINTLNTGKAYSSFYKAMSKYDKDLSNASKTTDKTSTSEDTAKSQETSVKELFEKYNSKARYNSGSYGMNGKYSGLSSYGLSSFFNNWFI